MQDIKRIHIIQWVGPFKSYQELVDYKRRGDCDEVAHSSCFNFYYLSGTNRVGRPAIHRYFGIHRKQDGILKRLNSQHSVLRNLKEYDGNLNIWIGAFGDLNDHSEEKVEDIESFFIRFYRDLLTDNTQKKQKVLAELPSMSIINLWYHQDEKPWIRKPRSASYIHDVMVWEEEDDDPLSRVISASKLSKRQE